MTINNQQFVTIVKSVDNLRNSIRNMKGLMEYENDGDHTVNFKRDEAETGVDSLQACLIMMNKHHRAVASFIKRIVVLKRQYPGKPLSEIVPALNLSEPIEGRIADVMNYYDLLTCLLIEQGYNGELLSAHAPHDPVPPPPVSQPST